MTSGGIALKFFASIRLEIRSTGKIKSVSTTALSSINLCIFSLFHQNSYEAVLCSFSTSFFQVKGDEEIGLKVRARVQKSKVSWNIRRPCLTDFLLRLLLLSFSSLISLDP